MIHKECLLNVQKILLNKFMYDTNCLLEMAKKKEKNQDMIENYLEMRSHFLMILKRNFSFFLDNLPSINREWEIFLKNLNLNDQEEMGGEVTDRK